MKTDEQQPTDTYRRPQLIVYGNIRELTQTQGLVLGNFDSVQNFRKTGVVL